MLTVIIGESQRNNSLLRIYLILPQKLYHFKLKKEINESALTPQAGGFVGDCITVGGYSTYC